MNGGGQANSVALEFRRAVTLWGSQPFLEILPGTAGIYQEQARTLGYADAAAAVDVLVDRYRRAGYGAGHRVGLMLDNRAEFFLHWLALNECGASVVPLNADLRPAELGYLVANSGLVLVVAAGAYLARIQAVPMAAIAPDALPPPAPAGAGASGECAVLYTSGTTGKPKGCILSNDYFIRAGAWYIASGGLSAILPGRDRLITPLPMTHMNAMAYSTMAMLMSGGCIIPLDRFHPRSWWDSVRESRATIVHYLGVMPSMLLGAPPAADDAVHHVRFGFGAGIDPGDHGRFEARFGFPLLEAWAMTETGAGAVVIANREPRRVGASLLGVPGPAMELRIVDEGGCDAANGAAGELLVRAAGCDPRAGFFSGYLHDEAATVEAWEGGWFHTGDVVREEATGDLVFIDRRKNVIRRSGENISALEVESVLRRHAAVAAVAVAGTPDAVRGEEVLACVVLHPGGPVDRVALAAEIVAAARVELSYFKIPGWIAFVEDLPLTVTQKVQRGELKARARMLPGEPCCIDTRPLKTRSVA